VTFKYKTTRAHPRFEGPRLPRIAREEEVLAGVVQGKDVPEDEERFFRGAMKTGRVRDYWAQFNIGAPGLPGSRTLDALVDTDYGYRAFEIDGVGFVHRGDTKKAEDRLADMQRVDGLREMGVFLRKGIEHVPDAKLMNQADADRETRDLL